MSVIKVVRHGTEGAYSYHGCRCDRCRSAHADYISAWRNRQKPPGPRSRRHGLNSTYVNYRCRCKKCCEAASAYARGRHASRTGAS